MAYTLCVAQHNYNGLVRPSDWLSDKITVIDENWFERMSKRKVFYQP